MFRISEYSRLLNTIAIIMLVAGLTTAQALTPAGAKRPATVPANYVITPFGYFHPSCVATLAKGDAVRQDENAIRHADGTSDSIHVCAYAHYKADGEKVVGDEPATERPTISHSWVEYASATTSSSYGELNAYWQVPPAPSVNNGQTVFLFPGMEDYNDVVTIIQPVLGWNADFPSAWGIASWNCCASGTVFEATPVRVNSTDWIYGTVVDMCAPGVLSCASWVIITTDESSGESSVLANTSSQGQTFNWAFAGVLEVYNISQCADYPPIPTSFNQVALETNAFTLIANPGWSTTNLSSGLTPQCGYGVSQPQPETWSVTLGY